MQTSDNELLKRLMLADASFLTLTEKEHFTKNLDSFNDLAVMSIIELSSILNRDLTRAVWNGSEVLKKARVARHLIDRLGIQFTFFDKPDYPAMLREMKDPPYVIFYRGNLECLKENCVSMVGSRKITGSGKMAAFNFAKEASDNNTTVVSGLAFGIDVCSHRGALEGKGGKTVAVLPGGIDTIVPASHSRTAAKILQKGGIILSEYTPGTPAQNFRFVQRNRIIAALSPATVVVQAAAGSGAMITANFCLDYNRELYFHQACFDEQAKVISDLKIKELNALALTGEAGKRKAESKLFNSPQRFVEDGAPVVDSWTDFCEKRSAEYPGFYKVKTDGQMELFDK